MDLSMMSILLAGLGLPEKDRLRLASALGLQVPKATDDPREVDDAVEKATKPKDPGTADRERPRRGFLSVLYSGLRKLRQ